MHKPLVFRYCPQCRAELIERSAFNRPRPVCPQCGFIHLRDPKVSVVALVTRGPSVLLVRRRYHPGKGLWALPGGYMEADEMPQDALRREMVEETGLQIRNIRFVDFFPLLDFDQRRSGIVVAFKAAPTEPEPESRAGTEARDDVSEIRWFDAHHIPGELAFASTRALLRRWRQDLGIRKEMP